MWSSVIGGDGRISNNRPDRYLEGDERLFNPKHSVAAELLRRTRISATLLNLLSPEALDIDVISTRILASERLICNDLTFTSVWG